MVKGNYPLMDDFGGGFHLKSEIPVPPPLERTVESIVTPGSRLGKLLAWVTGDKRFAERVGGMEESRKKVGFE